MSTRVSPFLHAKLLPGVIYFARSLRTGLVKVGYTRNLKQRIRGLAVEARSPIRLIHTIKTKRCSLDEKPIHRMLAHFRVHGEWFRIDEYHVANVCAEYRIWRGRLKRHFDPLLTNLKRQNGNRKTA